MTNEERTELLLRLREDAQNEDIASCADAADELERVWALLDLCKKWLPKEEDW